MLDNFDATLFQPPFELASAALYLHYEIVPGHDARDYTSDKKFCNNFGAEL